MNCVQDSQIDNVEEIALKIFQWPKASGTCSHITVIVQGADPVCVPEDGKFDIEQLHFGQVRNENDHNQNGDLHGDQDDDVPYDQEDVQDNDDLQEDNFLCS
ncbi:adenosine kinase [Trifolium repens]|nr:adenosine kinase [Trifolium repens]